MPSPPHQREHRPETTHDVANAGQPKAKVCLYTPTTKENIGYNYYLDLLDFKRGTRMREQFASLLINYHNTPERRYLRKEDGDGFTALVNGFLDLHGDKFFGERQRSHLKMSDTTVGLLYHRDPRIEESYLWRTIADFFHWRSYCAVGGKRHKRPASPDQHPSLAESSSNEANEGDTPQKRRRSRPQTEIQPNPSVTKDQEQGHAPGPLRRRGRPRIKPVSPDGHRITEGQTHGREGIPLRRRGRPRLRRESMDGHRNAEGQDQGPARRSLRRRGRPRNRPQSPVGHGEIPLRTEGEEDQDHVQPLNTDHQGSLPSPRSDGDGRHRDDHCPSPAQTSQPTIRPEAPDIPPRRTSHGIIIDPTASDGKQVKSELPDAECYEITAISYSNPASLPSKILNNTNLLVRVSNQPNIAPAFVKLRLCRDIETMFPVLIAECDVQALSVTKVSKISVTFPWNREELRLRRGRREDWIVFCEALRQRWQSSEVVDGGSCRVEMLVHVDV